MPVKADLEVRAGLVIPAAELVEVASRAGGPGGQNVNKVNTRVTLRWDLANSPVLSESRRARLIEKLGSRLTLRGVLIVHASRMRSRGRNRELARERIARLLDDALTVRHTRTATRPTRASKQRLQQAKQRRSRQKRLRSRVRSQDE